MKRVVALILVLVLSLSLGACTQDKAYEKYQLIIDNLENGHYENAIDIIESMAAADNAVTDGTNPSNSKEPELTTEQIAWQTKVVGTWTPNESATKEGHTGFAIKADGTCTVDGKNYTWTIGNATETDTWIDVRDGQKMVCQLHISVNENYGYKQASMNVYIDEHRIQSTTGTYYRNEDYTVVEISSDNWQDYFEVEEITVTKQNAFGEASEFWGYTYFRLKDTCGTVNSSLSSGGVEFQCVSTCQDITVDLTNMTYVPVGEVHNTSDHNSTTELRLSSDANGKSYYGISIGSFCADDVNKELTDTVWRPMNIEILRVQATVYIVK